MNNNSTRRLRVAAVQVQSSLGQTQVNLNHFTPLVEQAASQGVQLIILPELAASGYSMSKLIWDAAETRQGATIRWLEDISARLEVYVGIGFIEADGEDFYNTYALAAPNGKIAGFVRKTMAETYCFRCSNGSHVIDTPLGKIGLGICADNHFVPMVRLMQEQGVDLMLMPHALPGAFKTGGLVNPQDIEQSRKKARGMAPLYAQFLGVPAIFANAVGPRGPEKWAGIVGGMMTPEAFRILGLSTIVDGDGMIKGELDETEGVLVADVNLDPARKVCIKPESYGRYGGGWVHPLSSPLVDLICSVDAFFCGMSYWFSHERRQKAQAVSSNEHG